MTRSIDKAYMHVEDAYTRVGNVLDTMRGMRAQREPLEQAQLDLFKALKEMADLWSEED